MAPAPIRSARRAGMSVLAGALALAGLTVPAAAQFFARPIFGGFYHSGPLYAPVPRGDVGIGALAVIEDLRDQGYRQVSIAARQPDVFVVDAVSPRGQPVRLIVDAYDGEILERMARNVAAASPESRRRDPALPPRGDSPAQPRSETLRPDGRVAGLPIPPRRPGQPAEAARVSPQRPAPVAPARNPADWAPLNSVPPAALE